MEIPTCRTVYPVFSFAAHMQSKLEENAHKGGWDDDSAEELLARLVEETRELRTAIRKGKPKAEVVEEAADVANFAMMIAEVYEPSE